LRNLSPTHGQPMEIIELLFLCSIAQTGD